MPSSANPFSFFTNSTAQDTIVQAPAYSITKVLTTAAAVLVPLGTVVVAGFTKLSFSSWQIVSLAIGLLLLLAILASADVLGRSYAAAAKQKAQAAPSAGDASAKGQSAQTLAAIGQILLFKEPVVGQQHNATSSAVVYVVGLCPGDTPCYLVHRLDAADGTYVRLPVAEVAIPQS